MRNTDHTSSQDETKAEVEEAEEKEEVKADIKSNNPHLTGGEKPFLEGGTKHPMGKSFKHAENRQASVKYQLRIRNDWGWEEALVQRKPPHSRDTFNAFRHVTRNARPTNDSKKTATPLRVRVFLLGIDTALGIQSYCQRILAFWVSSHLRNT